MLCVYVMESKENWIKHTPLLQSAYNNNYHASNGMTPYEALYRRLYRSQMCWGQYENFSAMRTNLIQETTKKICIAHDKICSA